MLALLFFLGLPLPAAAQATIFPEWMGRVSDVVAGQRESLIDDRVALFDAAPPATGALEHAVLLCRFDVDDPPGERWDTFADPDLRVVLSVGRQRFVAWGTENSRGEVISFAGVDLSAGASLRFRVSDRDVTYDETIGAVTARYAGALPLTAAAGVIRVACRALDPAVAASRREDALARADGPLSAGESAVPDLTLRELGTPQWSAIEAALATTIAYAGHHDADVVLRRERLAAARRRFDGLLRTAIRDAGRSAPRRGASVPVAGATATVDELTCRGITRRFPMVDATSTRCVVVVRYDGALASLGTPDVVDARGVAAVSTGTFTQEDGRVVIALPIRVTDRMLLRLGPEPLTMAALR